MSITAEAIKALLQSEATTATNAALSAAIPELNGQGIFAHHQDMKTIDLEGKLPLRRRARGAMSTEFVAPFAEYVAAHAQPGTTVFINANDMSAQAVLNFGSNALPGHCDNITNVELKETAAYKAMTRLLMSAMSQRDLAEWLEEWGAMVMVREGHEPDAPVLDLKSCINAVRNVTIKAVKDAESAVGNFSQTRSALEEISMQAKADAKLPPFLHLKFQPYQELVERTFIVRVSAITSRDEPLFRCNLLAAEQHQEDMANEFAQVVCTHFDQLTLPDGIGAPQVLLGTYQKAS